MIKIILIILAVMAIVWLTSYFASGKDTEEAGAAATAAGMGCMGAVVQIGVALFFLWLGLKLLNWILI